jgi:hypothetical protein
MINELEIKKYDKMFGTRSKVFKCTNTIIIESPLDSWQIKVINRQIKPYCLLHKNKFGKINKYHIQSWKTCLYHAYNAIYTHKGLMSILNKSNMQ